jgi:selenocysteine lyase/cysteine desulfurase
MNLPDDPRFADFRRQMPITGKWAFFDHAACSPITGPGRDAIANWLLEATNEGGTAWGHWHRRLEETRTRAAKMVSASAEEIALIRSTTEGIMLVAEGYPWCAGDNVVVPDNEFPTNQYPWMNLASRGVETRRIATDGGQIDLNRLDDACDARTRIVSLSWVGFLSGWRTDLKAAADMAHRHGALLFVDAIQAFGAFPLDVAQTGIDFFAAGGQKWMLGLEGTGLFYIRRQHLPLLRPVGIGSHSVVHDNDYTRIELRLKDTAARYEGGGPNSAGFIGLGASLDLLASVGIAEIGNRILEITEHCRQRLEEVGAAITSPWGTPKNRSGILTFELPGCDSLALRKHCYTRHVALAHRSGKLRISPHAYIDRTDIDQMIAMLEEGKKSCKSA